MKKAISKWVVGHKVTPSKVSGDYDFITGETPAGTTGPPPHFHTKYNEIFYVLEGVMEFMVDGEVINVGPGETVDLPPNTLHTFGNKSSQACRWINIHSPKGFLAFFNDMGIDDETEDAALQSVDQVLVERLIQEAANYDMHIKI